MNGFEKRSEKKKRIILKVASKMFSHHGIASCKIVDIAKVANVSPVSMYTYFVSKENLVNEVLRHVHERYVAKYETIIFDQSQDFKAKIEAILVFESMYRKQFHGDFIQILENPENPQVIEWQEGLIHKRLLPALIKLVEQGKNERIVSKTIPTSTAVLYMHMFEQFRSLDLSKNDKLLSDLVVLFIYGLGGKADD